jgi:hypothetical protein
MTKLMVLYDHGKISTRKGKLFAFPVFFLLCNTTDIKEKEMRDSSGYTISIFWSLGMRILVRLEAHVITSTVVT